MRPFEFTCETEIVFGAGRLRELGERAGALRLAQDAGTELVEGAGAYGGRAMLVSYRDYRDVPALTAAVEGARDSLREAGLEVVDFFEAVPDPGERSAIDGRDRALAEGAHVVVGIGGGSVLDLAKAVAFMATNPGRPWDYVACNPERKPGAAALPCVTVPTTAGTGSEVSLGSVLTLDVLDALDALDVEKGRPIDARLMKGKIKGTIIDRAMAPRVAIVDPELALGAPPGLTAACGADALGHAVEAVLSRKSTPVAACLARESAAIIFRHLGRACARGLGATDGGAAEGDMPEGEMAGGGELEARSQMAWAATLSGLAIGSAGTIATHAMSHALGSILHVQHGVAVAVLTVPVLKYCADAAEEEFAALARAADIGCGPDAPADAVKPGSFIEATAALLRDVGLPAAVTVEASEWSDDLPLRLARNAAGSAPFAVDNTPRDMDEAAMADIFARVVRRGA